MSSDIKSKKKTDLADGDRATFVPERETAELGVVCEALDADGLGGFNEGDDLLACVRVNITHENLIRLGIRTSLGELWWLS